MDFKKVKSGMIDALAYDDSTWTFGVRFKSGLTLLYASVPPEVADEFLNAESKGKHFNGIFKHLGYKAMEDPDSKKPEKPLPNVEGGLTEEDMAYFDKVTAKQEQVSDAALVSPERIELSSGTPIVESVMAPPMDFGVQEFDPHTGHRSNSGMAEVLAAWTPPENPVSAIIMLQERAPEIDALIASNGELARDAMSVSVTDALSYASAGQTLKNLVEVKDRHFKLLDPIRAMLYQTYQAAGEKQKLALTCLEGAITYVKRVMVNFEQEQERIRQQKIREDNERREAEARRLQDEQSQQLTLAEIDDALEAGDTQRAEELAAKPIEVPKPYIPPVSFAPEVLPPAGQSTRANWKCDEESANIVEFLTAVKSGKVDIAQAAKWVKFDFSSLNKLAKSLQDAFSVPGVRAFNDPIKTVRRK